MKVGLDIEIPLEYKQMRLDAALAKCLPDYSRSQLAQWIKSGQVLINGEKEAPKYKVEGGETIAINAEIKQLNDLAEDIPLDIVYEDEHILVINKPKNCVVHPGAGNWDGTLLNALLFHNPNLKSLPRAGIIHRLDKDTTGLMVVTKSQQANHQLIEDLKNRDIIRRYYALVKGEIISGGEFDFPIGRHPRNRLKMAVVHSGKPALTRFTVKKRFSGYTWVDVKLESGRTHQIRVHFSYKKHPLIGDPLYKASGILSPNLSEEIRNRLQSFPRPALHAYHLSLTHPATKEKMSWEQPLPEDMKNMIRELSNECDHSRLASPELD